MKDLAGRRSFQVRIECLVAEGCASLASLERNIRKALEEEGMEAEITVKVLGEEEARRMGVPGSPTVLIDGEDLEGVRPLEGTIS
jgi:predicted DsbA family dithiol-disulfide isomerase